MHKTTFSAFRHFILNSLGATIAPTWPVLLKKVPVPGYPVYINIEITILNTSHNGTGLH